MTSINFIYSPTDSQLDNDNDIVVHHQDNPSKIMNTARAKKHLTDVEKSDHDDMNNDKKNNFYLSSLKKTVALTPIRYENRHIREVINSSNYYKVKKNYHDNDENNKNHQNHLRQNHLHHNKNEDNNVERNFQRDGNNDNNKVYNDDNDNIITRKLNISLFITDINQIDVVNESFNITMRAYILYEINTDDPIYKIYIDKARVTNDHIYYLKKNEVDQLTSDINPPIPLVINTENNNDDTSPIEIHVIGGIQLKSAVIILKTYHMKCRQYYKLHDFPFDIQDLIIEFRILQQDITYDLSIYNICLSSSAIGKLEWKFYEPIVVSNNSSSILFSSSMIIIPCERKSNYYVYNIIIILFLLSSLGLFVFTIDIYDFASRQSTILTLILTVVAFKFSLSTSLPKVPYNTIIDHIVSLIFLQLTIIIILSILPVYMGYKYIDHTIGFICLSLEIISIILCSIYIFDKKRALRINHKSKPIQIIGDTHFYSYLYTIPPFLDS